MDKDHKMVSVVIPALNEPDSIGLVIRDIPKSLVDEIISFPIPFFEDS